MRKLLSRPTIAAGLAGLALAIAGCQHAASGAAPSGATPPAAVDPPAAGNPPSAAPPAPPAARQWTMPKLVGVNLQQAQDQIQALTGDPVFFTSSHDATGQHRHQVLDSNWKVCSQSIAPGAPFTSASTIDFGAVQLDERCP